jgi:hypothetical protein
VRLAGRASAPIARPVGFDYVWGEGREEIDRRAPCLRIVNLETAITTSEDAWPGKRIHDRMHPASAGALTAARIDACLIANNQVLDWGRAGLAESRRRRSRARGVIDGSPACASPSLPFRGRRPRRRAGLRRAGHRPLSCHAAITSARTCCARPSYRGEK